MPPLPRLIGKGGWGNLVDFRARKTSEFYPKARLDGKRKPGKKAQFINILQNFVA